MADSDLPRNEADREPAAEAVRERDELLRVLTEHTNDLIRLHDPDGRSVYASPSVIRFYGRTPAALFEFAHPDDVGACRRWWAEVLAGGTDRLHWRVRDAGGHWRWLETSPALVRYRDRPHVLTVCRDITERREAELALRASERKLNEAQRLARLGYWENDFGADRVSWSDEAGRILGLPPDETSRTGAGVRELVHPDDRPVFDEAFARALRGESNYYVEFRVVRPDGEVRYVQNVVDVVRDEADRPYRAFGAVQDITDRRRAEESLRDTTRKLNEAQRIAHLGHWEQDLVTGRVTASDETYRIFGLGPHEDLRTWAAWQERIHPEDRPVRAAAIDRALRGDPRYEVEYRVVRPDGAVRIVHSQGEIARDGAGRPRHLFGIVRDITERRQIGRAHV